MNNKELFAIIKDILREFEIEDGDIVDYANEYQSPCYGFSEKFFKRLKEFFIEED